jgi:hypothetical protein
MPDDSDRDRIVALETKQDYQDDFNDQFLAKLGSIEKNVRVISDWMQNKTGFIAGLIFCCGILGAAIGTMASLAWGVFHK